MAYQLRKISSQIQLAILRLTIVYRRRGEFSSLKTYTGNLLRLRGLEMILEQCSFH